LWQEGSLPAVWQAYVVEHAAAAWEAIGQERFAWLIAAGVAAAAAWDCMFLFHPRRSQPFELS
jgi:hypothetical protein